MLYTHDVIELILIMKSYSYLLPTIILHALRLLINWYLVFSAHTALTKQKLIDIDCVQNYACIRPAFEIK